MLEALMAPPRRPISKSDKLYFIQSNSRNNKTQPTNEIEDDADSQSAVAVDSSSIEISFEEEEINLDDFEAIHAAELKESLEIPEIVELLEFEDQLARDKKEAPHLREKMRSSPEIKWDDYENTFSENYEVVLSPGDMQAVEGAAVESSNQLNSDSTSDSSESTDQLTSDDAVDQSEATLDEILNDDAEEPMEVAFNVPGQDDDSFSSDSYYDDSYDYDDLAPGAFEGDDAYEPTTTIATTVSVGTGADEPDFYEPTTMMPTTILSTTLPKLTTVKTSTGTKMTSGDDLVTGTNDESVGGVNPDDSRQGTKDETNNGRSRLDYDPLDNVQPELKHIFNVQENDGATGNNEMKYYVTDIT